jgi:hypothetical protein
MTNLVDKLRLARQKPHVALHDYTVLRSKAPDSLVCVFEGHEDYPYYDTVFRKLIDEVDYRALVVNGKDQVLGLRELLFKRDTPFDKKVAYFIDKDFDGFKQFQPSENTYCTTGYSIENNLCSNSILHPLLAQEYLCHKTGEESTIETVTEKFLARLSEFTDLMRDSNRAIFFARKQNIRLQGINNQITKYINIDINGITATGVNHLSLIGWPDEIDASVIPESITEFEVLSPLQDWRGKFVLGVYTELLHKLKDDRCSATPQHFNIKAGMKFNPKGEIIRTLALLSPIPQCLRTFTLNLPMSNQTSSTPA